jgi:hypothetical protein
LGRTANRLAVGLPLSNGRRLDVYGKTGTGDQLQCVRTRRPPHRIAQGELNRNLHLCDRRSLLRHADGART